VLRDAWRNFQANDPLRLAAATSFFSSFALPPIIIILTEIFGLFGNPRVIRRHLFEQLGATVDRNVALQVRDVLKNVHALALNPGMKIAGFLFLLFVATTLFEVIKRSLDQLWESVPSPRGIGALLLHRVKSIGIIIAGGILIMLTIVLYRPLAVLAVVCWFVLILKYLSNSRPGWKAVLVGGAFTGVLFSVGEVLLHMLLGYNNIKTIYGASGALVLLLLFVFYCSFIFYYGACVTREIETGMPSGELSKAR
jgi:membrane protein